MRGKRGFIKTVSSPHKRFIMIVAVMFLFSGLKSLSWADDMTETGKSVTNVKKVDNPPKEEALSEENSPEEIEERKRILDSARQVLELRLKALHMSMENSDGDEAESKAIDQQAVTKLINIYENMSPREAAAVFDVMDPRVLVEISSRMNTRKLSAIMAQMSRERVNMVSQYLVGVRKFRNSSSFSFSAIDGNMSDESLSGNNNENDNSKTKQKSRAKTLLPSRQ